MLVKLTQSMAGTHFSFTAGDVVRCSDATGAQLIKNHRAVAAPDAAHIAGDWREPSPGDDVDRRFHEPKAAPRPEKEPA